VFNLKGAWTCTLWLRDTKFVGFRRRDGVEIVHSKGSGGVIMMAKGYKVQECVFRAALSGNVMFLIGSLSTSEIKKFLVRILRYI